MGAQKVLLPYGDTTILGHILREIAASTVDTTLVITGHGAGPVETRCGTQARVVYNPDYREGMLSSVRAGVHALPEGASAMLICLGDHPQISAALIDTLIGAWRESPGSIVVPLCRGRRGHPVLIDAGFQQEIVTRFDNAGLRGLLHAHPASVREVPWDDPEILQDLDTPDQYQAALKRKSHPS